MLWADTPFRGCEKKNQHAMPWVNHRSEASRALRMNSQPATTKPAEAGSAPGAQPASAGFPCQTPNSFGGTSGGPAATRLALTNSRIVLPDRVVTDQALVIESGRIVGQADRGDLGTDIQRIDVAGNWIMPGLVDIHTHGALRHTFNEPDRSAWTTITRENLRRGTTALLATFAPAPDLEEGLAFCRQWMREEHDGARVLGAYLESPYVNVAQKGALDASCVRAADDGSAAALLQYTDILRVFMLAPELPGALDLVEAVNAAGIVPAAGHTMAYDAHVRAAMQFGLRHVTHLWSAMSLVVREGPWRKPGVLEAALTFDGLTAEMIADNRHLPPTLMRLAYKCLGPDRLCAVSDALAGAGLPEGSAYTMGGMSYEVRDGVGMMLDRSSFAGSATLLPQMLPVLIEVVGIPLVEAVRMVTLTPARIIGVDGDSGSLEPGKRADLVVFDDAFAAQRVMLAGEWV
jgi:N-acetylglucosamine-6-phosphate deacetylase